MKDVHGWKTFMQDTTLSTIRPLNTIHIVYLVSFSFGKIVLALKVRLPFLCYEENEGESHALRRPARRASWYETVAFEPLDQFRNVGFALQDLVLGEPKSHVIHLSVLLIGAFVPFSFVMRNHWVSKERNVDG
jgi:hypothetical protein